ncbi:MAG: threonine--tRNA ligase [Phycisphaerae bacterium]|nr:threonine--tRNA ligase [Phycisphaerae bacterium]
MSTQIALPDGSTKQYDDGVTPARVAEDISAGLARAAVAAEVDGALCDLTAPLAEGRHELRLLTDRDGDAALEVLRHTAAHVLAQAVVRLYGEGVQYTIGPALIDDFQYGFYYDFDLPRSISADDLAAIEGEMRRIVGEKIPLDRVELPPDEAKAEMRRRGQHYKIEMIDDLVAEAGAAPPTVSLYRQGDFVDMCRGPHLPHTGKLGKAFKLVTAAGAYWRGDERNKMLTRIYGVAFFSKADLDAHVERIEQARQRDHRVLGRQLGLFLIDEQVGPGLPLWLPKGTIIRMELETWLRGELLRRGYQPVITPHIGKTDLFRTSGHYPYYEHGLFPTMQLGEDDGDGYLLKPMNCPFHMRIYKSAQHSYRELPIRYSEFGTVYRLEQSGELNGLVRVRGFTQDDAHILCTHEQIEQEVASCVELTKLVLSTLGLDDYRVRVGLRDPDSSKYTGPEKNWDLAETNLRNVVRRFEMDYTEEPGEAAFYGPKIDFVVTDALGREWQLGTIQVDYNLPERFDLTYTGPDNAPHRPVMIHRAPLGAPERFIGILIEHFAGAFPLWLAPVQVAVLPVSDKFADYGADVARRLRDAGFRAELDDSPEKIGAKIRRATMDKVPYMAVVGGREAEQGTVAVRERTDGDRGPIALDAFVEALAAERDSKGRTRPLAGADGTDATTEGAEISKQEGL